MPIYIIAIMFTVLHPITLIVAVLARHFLSKRKEGHIRLPPDEEDATYQAQRPGREVQADWS